MTNIIVTLCVMVIAVGLSMAIDKLKETFKRHK